VALVIRAKPWAELRLDGRRAGYVQGSRTVWLRAGRHLVELTGPDNELWTWGPEDAPDRVTGPAPDFCLLVTQRRHRDDLALVIDGPAAAEWMSIAQAFAGAAGTGRPRRTDA